jgi:plastocyanin
MKRMVVGSILVVLAACVVGGYMVEVAQTQSLPAPTVDRVGFPTGYRETFKLFYTFDNYQNRQIRKVWGNAIAASVKPGETFNFPYGSVILFESFTVRQDARGEPILDLSGRFIPNAFTTIFVMRKERGFGVEYGPLRNGEWEYVAYNPDGTYNTPPQNTQSCALCHLTGGPFLLTATSKSIGAQWDYVFRPDLFISGGSGAVPKGVMQHYVFVPSVIHAQEGETVTVYNSDQLLHRIVADDNSFDTGVMTPGGSFSLTAGKPGTVIAYHCTLHSRMRGQVIVDPPPVVPVATGLTLSSPTARVGSSYSVTFVGTNLDAGTYFDVRFRAPGSTTELEGQNWQQGMTASHDVPAGTALGQWTIVGIRPHRDPNDHLGPYVPVSVVLTIIPF